MDLRLYIKAFAALSASRNSNAHSQDSGNRGHIPRKAVEKLYVETIQICHTFTGLLLRPRSRYPGSELRGNVHTLGPGSRRDNRILSFTPVHTYFITVLGITAANYPIPRKQVERSSPHPKWNVYGGEFCIMEHISVPYYSGKCINTRKYYSSLGGHRRVVVIS